MIQPMHPARSEVATADAVARVRQVLAGEERVLAAWLFGSRARGGERPGSDVDVAILLDGADEATRQRIRADVVAAVPVADLVVLNDAPIALAYRVLRDGQVLLARDEAARARFWVRTVDRYLDMAPARRMLADGLRHRLEEGRFGRP